MKDVKNLLKANKDRILPDEGVKKRVKRRLGFEEVQISGSALVIKRRGILAGIICLILGLAIVAYSLGSVINKKPFPGVDNDRFNDIKTPDAFYAYGVASVGAVIKGGTQSLNYPLSGGNMSLSTVAAADSDKVAQITKYMTLVEGLLSEEDIVSMAIVPEGDYSDYQYGMQIKCGDLTGNKADYLLYYNKVLIGTEIDKDETEEDYALEGVMIVDGTAYPVKGSYKTENEGTGSDSEQEEELFFRAYMAQNTYIEVTRETETETEDGDKEEEVEYIYSYFLDGVLQEKTHVEYEKENNELELKLIIEKAQETKTLVFAKQIENGKTIIKAKLETQDESLDFRIYIENGKYRYVFDDGTVFEEQRDFGAQEVLLYAF